MQINYYKPCGICKVKNCEHRSFINNLIKRNSWLQGSILHDCKEKQNESREEKNGC